MHEKYIDGWIYRKKVWEILCGIPHVPCIQGPQNLPGPSGTEHNPHSQDPAVQSYNNMIRGGILEAGSGSTVLQKYDTRSRIRLYSPK